MQNEIVLALCWTLIHSLWQGLLLAMVTGAVMIGTRKSDARKRYGALTFLFFLFIGITIITFLKEWQPAQQQAPAITTSNFISKDGPVITAVTEVTPVNYTANTSLLDRFKDYFNTHASLIVMIWFVVFIARFIKLTADLIYVQRLKSYKVYPVPGEWKEKLTELLQTVGIRKQIRLLESGIVKVPVVMGVLKPVILLPLGLLAHLPSDEIEAILLHELAHIKRKDYFVNLLQSFAETVFFFNPALMWLSSMIREERENCCDDIAISITNSKAKFINALIAFQEYHFNTPAYTVGFPGKKNHLLNRVKRIVNNRNKTLNATEKSILSFGMGILILLSFAAAKKIKPEIKTPLTVTTVFTSNRAKDSVNRLSNASDELTFTRSVSVKESTVNIVNPELYSPLLHEYVDTTPIKVVPSLVSGKTVLGEEKSNPVQLKTYSVVSDSISNLFTGISVDFNNDNNSDIRFVSATKKDGTLYNFRKVKGVLTELFVNTKPIPAGEFNKYTQVISDIEQAVSYRKERSLERRNLAQAKQAEMLFNKKNKMELDRQNDLKQHLIDREADRLAMEAKTKAMNAKRVVFDTAVMNYKKDVLRNSKAKVNEQLQANARKRLSDRIKMKTVRDGLAVMDTLHVVQGKRTNGKIVFDTIDVMTNHNNSYELNRNSYPHTIIWLNNKKAQKKSMVTVADDEKKQQELKNDNDANWYTKYDQVIRYSDLVEEEARLKKLENTKQRQLQDNERLKESATQIRNIIRDLEKEGININMETGWLALDKDQFVVDGKNISPALHEKFRSKYIKSKDGWGYYYGPVRVRGRGIFLDYQDVVK